MMTEKQVREGLVCPHCGKTKWINEEPPFRHTYRPPEPPGMATWVLTCPFCGRDSYHRETPNSHTDWCGIPTIFWRRMEE